MVLKYTTYTYISIHMNHSLGYRGGAFFGVDHSLAGFRSKRNREAADEDLLANVKVRNKLFAHVAAMGDEVIEPSLKLQTMVGDVSMRIQKFLDTVTAAQAAVDNTQQPIFQPNQLDLSPLSEKWNELVRAVNPYLTGPNNQLLSDEDSNQLKQMITNQLQAPVTKLKTDIAVKLQQAGLMLSLNRMVINADVLFGQGLDSIENQIEDEYYLPVRYGPQRGAIQMGVPGPAAAAAPQAPPPGMVPVGQPGPGQPVIPRVNPIGPVPAPRIAGLLPPPPADYGPGDNDDEDDGGPEDPRVQMFQRIKNLKLFNQLVRLAQQGRHQRQMRRMEQQGNEAARQYEQNLAELDQLRAQAEAGQLLTQADLNRAADEAARLAAENADLREQANRERGATTAQLMTLRRQNQQQEAKINDLKARMEAQEEQTDLDFARERRAADQRLAQREAEFQRFADIGQQQLDTANEGKQKAKEVARNLERALVTQAARQRAMNGLRQAFQAFREGSAESALERVAAVVRDPEVRQLEGEAVVPFVEELMNSFGSPASSVRADESFHSARSGAQSQMEESFQSAQSSPEAAREDIAHNKELVEAAVNARVPKYKQRLLDFIRTRRISGIKTGLSAVRVAEQLGEQGIRLPLDFYDRAAAVAELQTSLSPPLASERRGRRPRPEAQSAQSVPSSASTQRMSDASPVSPIDPNRLFPSPGAAARASPAPRKVGRYTIRELINLPKERLSELTSQERAARKDAMKKESPPSRGRGDKTDYDGPLDMHAVLPSKKKRPFLNMVNPFARSKKGRLPRASYEGFNDNKNEIYMAAPPTSTGGKISEEIKHMPILTGNRGLPKIYGRERQLKNLGFYKPGRFGETYQN